MANELDDKIYAVINAVIDRAMALGEAVAMAKMPRLATPGPAVAKLVEGLRDIRVQGAPHPPGRVMFYYSHDTEMITTTDIMNALIEIGAWL